MPAASPESPVSPPLTVQALLFEEGREKEEASTMQVPARKDEPVAVEAVPVAPVLRKVRGKNTMNTGRGWS